MKNILIHPADRCACGSFRVIQRGQVWNKFIAPSRGNETVVLDSSTYLSPHKISDLKVKVFMTQRQFYKEQINAISEYKSQGLVIINDLDDMLWQVPPTNPFSKMYTGDVRRYLKESIQKCDISTASTIPLADEIYKFARKNSIIVPNMLEPEWFMEPRPRKNEKLKVLWAGSSTHHGDLEALVKVVTFLEDKVDFIFMGALPHGITEEKNPNVGFVKGVEFSAYMRTLKMLAQEVDVAVAPLEPCRFNECKSNLKLLEIGAVGLPIITSDIYPYQDSQRKIKWGNKQYKEWIDILMSYSDDETLRMSDANISYMYSKKFDCTTEDNIEVVEKFFNEAFNLIGE